MKKSIMTFLCLLVASVGFAQFSNVAPQFNRPTNGIGFDWTTQYYTIYTISNGAQQVHSPFYSSSLTNRNTDELSSYVVKDYSPADGWTLIKNDFGSPQRSTDLPYLILYNRFTGTLRVFIASAQLYGQNDAATISLNYGDNSYRSALLSNYGLKQSALDDFDNNVGAVKVNNYFSNTTLFWLHADFVMNYDPCVCNYKNNLLFTVNFASNGNLQFKVDGQLIQNFNPSTNTDTYGRTGNVGKVSNSVSKNSAFSFTNATKGLEIGTSLAGMKFDALPSGTKASLIQQFGNTGIIMGAAKWLFGLFSDNSTVVRPLAFDINMRGEGSISYSNPYGSISLPVPGGNKSGLDVNTLPHYDNAMGIFNLIKTPQLLSLGDYSYSNGYDSGYGSDPGRGYWDLWHREFHFVLDGDVKYTINPDAGLSQDPQHIQLLAYYEIKYADESQPRRTNIVPLGCLKYYMPGVHEIEEYYSGGNGVDTYHFITGVDLVVLGKIKTADLSKDVIFEKKYKAQLGNIQFSAQYAANSDVDILPPSGCNEFLQQVNASEVNVECNSNKYKTLVTQY